MRPAGNEKALLVLATGSSLAGIRVPLSVGLYLVQAQLGQHQGQNVGQRLRAALAFGRLVEPGLQRLGLLGADVAGQLGGGCVQVRLQLGAGKMFFGIELIASCAANES
jgi:hypothetical protein